MYAAGGIKIEEMEDNKVKVTQTKFDGFRLFNQKELVSRGRTLYPQKKYKVVANTFSFQADSISPEWIREQMQLYGIRPKDLVHQLGINSSNISELINGKRPLSTPVSALFYYYFQTKRLGYELAKETTAEELAEALALVKARKAEQLKEGGLGVSPTTGEGDKPQA